MITKIGEAIAVVPKSQFGGGPYTISDAAMDGIGGTALVGIGTEMLHGAYRKPLNPINLLTVPGGLMAIGLGGRSLGTAYNGLQARYGSD